MKRSGGPVTVIRCGTLEEESEEESEEPSAPEGEEQFKKLDNDYHFYKDECENK